MLFQPPHHPLCATEVGYGAQGRNHGSKTRPREGGRLVQGHKASLVPRFSCQAHARLPPPPPRHTACVARLVPPGYPALTWCQSPPGPVPGWGFNGTGIQHLHCGGNTKGPEWLLAAPCQPAPYLLALTGLPLARHQQTGLRPFYVSIYCPKWGGASCPSLKGPEAGRLQAQWEVCLCGGDGGRMRSWGSHLTPNSWVGLRLTLFPRFECCNGPGSTAPTPRLGSKRKPREDSHSG